MPKLTIIISLGLLCMATAVMAEDALRLPTPDEYWIILREIADKEFKGKNFDMLLKTGYTFRYGSESDYSGDDGMLLISDSARSTHSHNIGATITIPLISKGERLAQRGKIVEFLEKGTELIQQLEQAIRIRDAQLSTLEILSVTAEEGVSGAIAVLELEEKIITQETLIKMYHRKIQGLLNPFQSHFEADINGKRVSFSDTVTISFEP